MCDKTFNVEHALSCPYGGFPSIRNNKIRDITAHLMSDVYHNVGTEPVLQPVTDERLTHRTANIEDGACLDIKADGFWEMMDSLHFLMCGFSIPLHTPTVTSPWQRATEEMSKKREGHTTNEWEKLSKVVFHLWFSLHQVVWVQLLKSSTGGWPQWLQQNTTKATAKHSWNCLRCWIITLLCHYVPTWVSLLSWQPCPPSVTRSCHRSRPLW